MSRLPLLTATLALSVLTILPLCGCHTAGAATGNPRAMEAARQAALTAARAEMETIPPPSKNRYMTITSAESWENPYLTIQPDMVTLHVLVADANTSDLGRGGMLRPIGARRQDLNVRLSDLPAALNSIPQSAWPYGRVIAVEEAHNIPDAGKPQVRRTMETAVSTINDLGVVMYEFTAQ